MSNIMNDLSQSASLFAASTGVCDLVRQNMPFYTTNYGAAYLGDSIEVLSTIPDNCVNLVVLLHLTHSILRRNTEMWSKSEYVDWFIPLHGRSSVF